MSDSERHRILRLARLRRVRWFLKPLPRRANIARYPVIKWFAAAARSRPYLWSFKRVHVIPALYVASVIAFLPLYGLQFLISFFGALLSRSNLPVSIALQFITNPLTAIPIYALTLWVGQSFIDMTGWGLPAEALEAVVVDEATRSLGARARHAAAALVVGGFIIGMVVGFVLDMLYRLGLWEAERFKARWQRKHPATAQVSSNGALEAAVGSDAADSPAPSQAEGEQQQAERGPEQGHDHR